MTSGKTSSAAWKCAGDRKSTRLNSSHMSISYAVFCLKKQDNGYAISVPVEVQTAGGSISLWVSGFPDFHFEEVDGTDPVASYLAFLFFFKYWGPAEFPPFPHPHVFRP